MSGSGLPLGCGSHCLALPDTQPARSRGARGCGPRGYSRAGPAPAPASLRASGWLGRGGHASSLQPASFPTRRQPLKAAAPSCGKQTSGPWLSHQLAERRAPERSGTLCVPWVFRVPGGGLSRRPRRLSQRPQHSVWEARQLRDPGVLWVLGVPRPATGRAGRESPLCRLRCPWNCVGRG